MKIGCTMYFPPKKIAEYGHITLTSTGIDLSRKNKFFAFGFGLLGALLTPSKEFHSILWDEVNRIELKQYGLYKKACYVTLKDDKAYVFRMPKPEEAISLMNAEYKKSKETKITYNSLFRD